MIINIRGTNGAGKTTLVRGMLGPRFETHSLVPYPAPTKRDPERVRHILGATNGTVCALGSYREGCGGCDEYSFKGAHDYICDAVRIAARRFPVVVFEGVIISTLFSRYATLAEELGGMTWVYLPTPVEECLSRIQLRNGGRPVKEDQVRAKVRAIARTRERAEELTYIEVRDDLPPREGGWGA